MNIPAFLTFTVSVSTVACLLSGCANVRHDFNYQDAHLLELKKTHRSDCEAMFGKPSFVEVKNTQAGRFEFVDYLAGHALVTPSDKSRRLSLEFRDDVLNAYFYVSNFDEDKTFSHVEKLKDIQVLTAKKEDVLRIVGKPAGIVLCPSHMFRAEDWPESGEIWFWSEMGISPQMMWISFDKDGVVTKAEAPSAKN